MGIGGTPEGVISAAAIKCLGGALQGKLWPRNEDERRRLVEAGARFVPLHFSDTIGGPSQTAGGWDTHGNNFTPLDPRLPASHLPLTGPTPPAPS